MNSDFREWRLQAGKSSTLASRFEAAAHRVTLAVLALATVCPLLVSPLAAQKPRPESDTTRADRERLKADGEKDLESARQRAGEIARDIKRLAAEQASVKTQLLEAANSVQQGETQLTAIEERLAGLTGREAEYRVALAGRHAELAKLLGAMQRMGRNPPPVIVTERQDVLEMIRTAKLMARVFPGLNEKAAALNKDLRQLESVSGEARAERDRLRAETDRLNADRTRLAALLETNRTVAQERTRELELIRRESDRIRRTVTELDELINQHGQLAAKQAEIVAYEAELKRQKAAEAIAAAQREAAERTRIAARTVPPAPATNSEQGAVPPSAAVLPEAAPPAGQPDGEPVAQQVAMNLPRPPAQSPIKPIVLAPGDGRALTNPGRLKPEIPFYRAKGRLPIPASGRHVIRFGENTQLGSRSPGLAISTRPGAQITSPSDGWVLFAGPFRSYGQLLIINAGDGYHILLTGLSRIDVQVGQFVLAAEPVGAMTTVAGPKTDGVSEGPVLYVEFRKDGKPIDPDPWWVSGQQKVQG